MIKSWYSGTHDIEYKDGHKEKEYRITFETTDAELAKRIEKFFQGIMDEEVGEADGPIHERRLLPDRA